MFCPSRLPIPPAGPGLFSASLSVRRQVDTSSHLLITKTLQEPECQEELHHLQLVVPSHHKGSSRSSSEKDCLLLTSSRSRVVLL